MWDAIAPKRGELSDFKNNNKLEVSLFSFVKNLLMWVKQLEHEKKIINIKEIA